MQAICSNDARMMNYDFKNRGVFRDTYSVLWCVRKLALDWFSFSEHPGSDWDRSWLLKTPLSTISISSFLPLFSNFVLPMLALSNPCFDCLGFLMYCIVC